MGKSEIFNMLAKTNVISSYKPGVRFTSHFKVRKPWSDFIRYYHKLNTVIH